jgi:hypothetical protein
VSLAPVPEADLRIELWASFVALLRSYAFAASQHGLSHQVSDIAECETFVTAGGQVLDIWCFPATGIGEWAIGSFESDPGGEFVLNLDGTVSLNGINVDMDHAAIDLIGALTKEAGQNRLEVLA